MALILLNITVLSSSEYLPSTSFGNFSAATETMSIFRGLINMKSSASDPRINVTPGV